MEIFVILLILFFIYIVLSHIRKHNIEVMTDDEYDLQIHKNEEESKGVRKKFSGITRDFDEVVKLQEENTNKIRKNKNKLDDMNSSKSNSANSKAAKGEFRELSNKQKK